MSWPEGGLRHFRPTEFDRPDELDARLLFVLDEVRERSGVPIKVTSDRRTRQEHERIYPDPASRPNSPHVRGTAIDFKPMPDSSENRLKVLAAIMELWSDGGIPDMGLEIATRHFHLDMDSELTRPHLWVGVSK